MARKYIAECEHCHNWQTPAFDTEKDALSALKMHEKNECVNRIREETRIIGAPKKRANDQTDIRSWARANGFTVGERGRIHLDIQNAYALATGGEVIQKAATVSVRVQLERQEIEAMTAEEIASNTVILKDKKGVTWRSNFCTKCKPGEPDKMHVYCKGTIHNATVVGDQRMHISCTCPCHEEEAA